MSSHLCPIIQTSKVNSLWFRPLQPGKYKPSRDVFIILCFSVREDLGLAKLEEILEQERRRYVDKGFFPHQCVMFIDRIVGFNLPFHGRTEMDNAEV